MFIWLSVQDPESGCLPSTVCSCFTLQGIVSVGCVHQPALAGPWRLGWAAGCSPGWLWGADWSAMAWQGILIFVDFNSSTCKMRILTANRVVLGAKIV